MDAYIDNFTDEPHEDYLAEVIGDESRSDFGQNRYSESDDSEDENIIDEEWLPRRNKKPLVRDSTTWHQRLEAVQRTAVDKWSLGLFVYFLPRVWVLMAFTPPHKPKLYTHTYNNDDTSWVVKWSN
ncbi:hypothetical protein Pmani_003890 [Petrolisthes manimaculis]|uniref:Uncharacterized protein n=1 Tax=Petrolisthes manimaculis TaxID=1843537 RepID=A0AAE1QHP0_9EUCA|nr:hypothetical protein Pmani_003890 [Petrolisthes manimaculis]